MPRCFAFVLVRSRPAMAPGLEQLKHTVVLMMGKTGVGLQIIEKQSLQETHTGTTEYLVKQSSANGTALDAEEAHSLLQDFADGDSDAFWKLWVLYKSHLYHLCLWQMDGVRE